MGKGFYFCLEVHLINMITECIDLQPTLAVPEGQLFNYFLYSVEELRDKCVVPPMYAGPRTGQLVDFIDTSELSSSDEPTRLS